MLYIIGWEPWEGSVNERLYNEQLSKNFNINNLKEV